MFGVCLTLLIEREKSQVPLLIQCIAHRLSKIIEPSDLYLKRERVPDFVFRNLAHYYLSSLTPYQYIELCRIFMDNLIIDDDEIFKLTLYCIFEMVYTSSEELHIVKINVKSLFTGEKLSMVDENYELWRKNRKEITRKLLLADTDILTEKQTINLEKLAMNSGKRRRSLLCIDGGGMRGVFALATLRFIVQKIYGGSDYMATNKFISRFDLIAGTSTGALIAKALAVGYSIDEIMDKYFALGEKVFARSWLGTPYQYYKYLTKGEYYDHTILVEQLTNFFDDNHIDQTSKPTVIVSADKSTSEISPFLFRNYHTLNSHWEGTSNEKVVNALRASTAAPTYFVPLICENKTLIDGGIGYNNPTEIAIFEAFYQWPDDGLDLILSIGTGKLKPEQGYSNIIGLAKDLLSLVTNSENIHKRVEQWIESQNLSIAYFRFNPEELGSVPLDCTDLKILTKGINYTEQYMSNRNNVNEFAKKFA